MVFGTLMNFVRECRLGWGRGLMLKPMLLLSSCEQALVAAALCRDQSAGQTVVCLPR